MSAPLPPARLFGYVAAEADVCILLRRGPSKRVLMVRWDLKTDEFEFGQWIFSRVYEYGCGLSADGTLFRYFAQSSRARPNVIWRSTAISRPPYFTALALWENHSAQDPPLRWSQDEPPRVVPPDIGAVPDRYRSSLPKILSEERGALWAGNPSEREALNADWIDVDHHGRTLIARMGRIFVREQGAERELIDLNPLRFRGVAPPEWATEWPE